MQVPNVLNTTVEYIRHIYQNSYLGQHARGKTCKTFYYSHEHHICALCHFRSAYTLAMTVIRSLYLSTNLPQKQ